MAAIGADDRPESSGVVPGVGRHGAPGRSTPTGELAVAAAPHGQIAILGRGAGGAGAPAIQGPAKGPFSVISPGDEFGAPYAMTSGYLGDLAVTARAGGEAAPLQLRVERFFTDSFVRSALAGAARGAVQALTIALDYRSDALVVWVQDGRIYARSLPANGSPRPVQRLASAGTHVSLSAVISDDYRGSVAWSEQRGSQTSVFLDRSATGMSFNKPQLLERFDDADGIAPPAASPRLVRLSTESVVLVWAGVSRGRWVVRGAPLDKDGMGARTTIARPSGDALLSDVATGPASDLLVLWGEPRSGSTGVNGRPEQAVFAARGFRVHPDRMWFGVPEQVAPTGANTEPTAAFDPDTDEAVAAWRASDGLLQFAVREATGHPDITGR